MLVLRRLWLLGLCCWVGRAQQSTPWSEWWGSFDCVRVITMEGSDQYPLFQAEASRVGLTKYTTQVETRDPDGGDAGCFRAHVRASRWGLENRCQALLVLEDDVYFERPDPTIDLSGVLSSTEYDVLYLGSFQGDRQWTSEWKGVARNGIQWWTHAYVVPPATQRWIASLGYEPKEGQLGTIDWVMNLGHEPHLPSTLPIPKKYTIVPQMAFQRFHPSQTSSHRATTRVGQLYQSGFVIDSTTQKWTETMARQSKTCWWSGTLVCKWTFFASSFPLVYGRHMKHQWETIQSLCAQQEAYCDSSALNPRSIDSPEPSVGMDVSTRNAMDWKETLTRLGLN